MTPVMSTLPRALTDHGRLKTESSLLDVNTNISGKIVPFGKLKVTNPMREIGASFTGTTEDINF